MREFVVSNAEAGRHLDRFLLLLLPKIPRNFLYRSLRGNGFRVNGKREHNKDLVIRPGDRISVYFTDDQFESFGLAEDPNRNEIPQDQVSSVPVSYEDENIIVFNKPAGLLSQKADRQSVSLTEIGSAMLAQRGLEMTGTFRPGVCNRLDRNTSGLVIMAKNLTAAQEMTAMIRERRVKKYYTAIVHGKMDYPEETLIQHYFCKDHKQNQLLLSETPMNDPAELVSCKVKTLCHGKEFSLVRIELLTGKSHQIRAQLSFLGHAIVGDPKYQPMALVKKYRALTDHQMLCATELVFEDPKSVLKELRGIHIRAELPEVMVQTIHSDFKWNYEDIYL